MSTQVRKTLEIELASLDEALKHGRLKEAFALVGQILIDVRKLISVQS